ncbi:hypothetical protein ciss_00800 [Carboxydothermus islandicus]|uniref:SLH domain-containing protein n=1 Tax=Carboxydothermus islandicus TaxID=661089 RepID=A0A1L8CZ27_9THEO|nr:multiheme c-type cytochrome [Carboxydothermus islandicus]GAV24147.1 hypothetical protein ciss_00800 [Carboxydothermus islandicus]
MKRTVLIVAGILVSLMLFTGAAFANSTYASQTGKACTYCHADMADFSKLTSEGQAFKNNGYKLPAPAPGYYTENDFAASVDKILGKTLQVSAPTSTVTRQEAYKYIATLLNLKINPSEVNKVLAKFKDSKGVNAAYKSYVAIMVKNNLVSGDKSGKDYYLNAGKVLTKTEAEALLAKAKTLMYKGAPKERTFVTSEKCKTCHPTEYSSWKEDTYHSKMIMKRDEGILKDAVLKWVYDQDGNGTNDGPTIGNVTKETFSILDVQYVVGSYWKQRYLVKNKVTGGWQLLNKQFNRMTGKWENYGNANDWNMMCATCHTTGYKLTYYDPANPATSKATWSELNVGCEACHGPGSVHVYTKSKLDIWNPAKKTKAEQTRACGYCHIRVENEKYKSPQGNYREDLPAPEVGKTFMPWDDWTKWYPEELVAPGIQPEDPFDKSYTGDLAGLFKTDVLSTTYGVYEEAKHHQQYQGFIQSNHYKKNILSCNDCHSPHKTKKTATLIDPKATCSTCHGSAFDVEKIMPGTAKTADNLYVRTHTFFAGQTRTSGPTATGKPVYYFGE